MHIQYRFEYSCTYWDRNTKYLCIAIINLTNLFERQSSKRSVLYAHKNELCPLIEIQTHAQEQAVTVCVV